jgi:hypothetical protein
MPFVIGGNQLVDTGYEVSNSARMNNNENFTKTISSTTSRNTFTISTWLKRSSTSGNGGIFGVGTASSDTGRFFLRFTSSDKLAATGGATNFRISNAVFRDLSAFYHIVCVFDSTNGTAQNRLRLYVNGVEITSWSSNNTVNSSQNTPVNESGKTHVVGGDGDNSSAKFSGYLAEFNFIDGQAKAPTDFGEFNDNGVWIPKKYDGTYTNNSFFLEFQNSGSLGNDTSGLGNNYTANNFNTVDQTTDTPTNNFATGNPLAKYINDTNVTYSEGNVKGIAQAVATSYQFLGNFGVGQGKWYWEVKATDVNQNNDTRIGVVPEESIVGITINGEHNQIVYRGDGSVTSTGESSLSSQGNVTDGMIVGVALDMDNFTVKWYLNGTLTSTISINSTYRNTNYFPFFRHINSGTVEFNFGNPSFSISSGNSDSEGHGNFEYAVPSGYFALCTKNLAEYG